MAEGTIKKLVKERGFGFILPSGGGADVFFHQSRVQGERFDSLVEGQRVTFEAEMGSRGPSATVVRSTTAPKPGQPATGMPREKPYRFLNPYNFVGYLGRPDRSVTASNQDAAVLWRCPPPPHDRYVGLKGRITCEVEAVTPLFVSDSHAVQKDDKKHKSYRFFEYDGNPALPASSLRGMVRAVYETVTNSCLNVFDDRRLSYRLPATQATTLVPARVEKHASGWVLRLLTGFVPLSPGRRPGGLYAASVHLYDPLRGPRSRVPKIPLHGLQHGQECYAVVEKRGIFTYVSAVAPLTATPPRPGSPSQRLEKGWLCINNQNIDNKRKERFFFRDPANTTGPTTIPLPDDVVRKYEDLIADYQLRHADRREDRQDHKPPLPLDAVVGKDPALSRYMYEKGDLKVTDGTLVYASLTGSPTAPTVSSISFAAPAAIPRVAYEHTIGDLLPYKHLHPCQEYDHLCPACRIFGWVWKTKSQHEDGEQKEKNSANSLHRRVAYTGRLRFSHGEWVVGSGGELDKVSLAILSTPKPTTTRFYLMDKAKGPRDKQEDDQAGYDGDNIIRGRKVYRHHGTADPKEYTRVTAAGFDGQDDQNRTVRGARTPGTRFRFTIDFENLADTELGALLWSLQLREGDRQGYHRLGYAKPLGWGSVRVDILKIELDRVDQRYGPMDAATPEPATERLNEWVGRFRTALGAMYGEAFEKLPNIADLMALVTAPPDLPVHYPRTTREPSLEGKNFEWFMGNKRAGKDAGPRLSLPLAVDDMKGLPLLDSKGLEVK